MDDPSIIRALPVVNLNGTSRKSLVEQRMEVVLALQQTLKAMAEMSPHGRDYQTAPFGAFTIAKMLHQQRVKMLDELRSAIEAEALALGIAEEE